MSIFRHLPARPAAVAVVAVGCPVAAAVVVGSVPTTGGPHPALAAVLAVSTTAVALAARVLAECPRRPDPLGADATEQLTAGVVRELEHRVSFQGRPWCTATLETPGGRIPIEVLPMPYAGLPAGALVDGQAVTVTGTVDRRADPVRLRVAGLARQPELTAGRP